MPVTMTIKPPISCVDVINIKKIDGIYEGYPRCEAVLNYPSSYPLTIGNHTPSDENFLCIDFSDGKSIFTMLFNLISSDWSWSAGTINSATGSIIMFDANNLNVGVFDSTNNYVEVPFNKDLINKLELSDSDGIVFFFKHEDDEATYICDPKIMVRK